MKMGSLKRTDPPKLPPLESVSFAFTPFNHAYTVFLHSLIVNLAGKIFIPQMKRKFKTFLNKGKKTGKKIIPETTLCSPRET
jgi:hypothetical protein